MGARRAGELLRRFWHPVARSDEAGARRRQVRVLGEDLILFRSPDGQAGLLTPRCCHRGRPCTPARSRPTASAAPTTTQDRDLPDGTILHRITEVRVPTVRIIPTPTLTVLRTTNNLSWAVPDRRNAHAGLRDGPRAQRPPTQGLPVYDGDRTRFGLSEEEHQRVPGHYETQVGQGAITLHSEDHLGSSDRGVSMAPRQFREQGAGWPTGSTRSA